MKSLENRRISLKATIEKVINQKGRFLSLFIRVGLPLMKSLLPPLAKIVLLPFWVTAATNAAIH